MLGPMVLPDPVDLLDARSQVEIAQQDSDTDQGFEQIGCEHGCQTLPRQSSPCQNARYDQIRQQYEQTYACEDAGQQGETSACTSLMCCWFGALLRLILQLGRLHESGHADLQLSDNTYGPAQERDALQPGSRGHRLFADTQFPGGQAVHHRTFIGAHHQQAFNQGLTTNRGAPGPVTFGQRQEQRPEGG